MAQRPNIPVSPEELQPSTVLTDEFSEPAFNEIPVSAKCVTFTCTLTPNAGQAQPNVAQCILEFQTTDPVTGLDTVESRVVYVDGSTFAVQDVTDANLDSFQARSSSPPAVSPTPNTWDWPFPIPGGKKACRLRSRESVAGDRDNPGSLRVLIAYASSDVGT